MWGIVCCDRIQVAGCLVRFNISASVDFDKVWVIVLFLSLSLAFQVSEPMSTATCILQTIHTWPQTKPTNKRIENNSETTIDNLLELSRFDNQSVINPNEDQKHKYWHLLMTSLHLTLKMTTAHVSQYQQSLYRLPSPGRSRQTNNWYSWV